MHRCQVCNRSSWSTIDGRCGRCRTKAARATEAEKHIAWYRDTGHCGGCGQPAVVCLCTDRRPCGCRDLHEMGGGIGVDLAELFAEPVSVPNDQEGLF